MANRTGLVGEKMNSDLCFSASTYLPYTYPGRSNFFLTLIRAFGSIRNELYRCTFVEKSSSVPLLSAGPFPFFCILGCREDLSEGGSDPTELAASVLSSSSPDHIAKLSSKIARKRLRMM